MKILNLKTKTIITSLIFLCSLPVVAQVEFEAVGATKPKGRQAEIANYLIETAEESRRVNELMYQSLSTTEIAPADSRPTLINIDQQYLNLKAPKQVALPESNPDEVLQIDGSYFDGLFSLNEQLHRIREKAKDLRTGRKLQALVEKGRNAIDNSYKLSETFVRISIGRCIDLHYKTVSIDNGDIQQTANNHYQFMNDCYNFAIGISPEGINAKFPKANLTSKTLPNHQAEVEKDVSAYEKAFGTTNAEINLIYKSQAMYGYEFTMMLMKNYATDKTPQAKALWLMRTIAFYTRDLADDLRIHNNYLKRAIFYVAELQQEDAYRKLMRYFANGGQGLSNTSLMQTTAELFYQFKMVLDESKPYLLAIDRISERDLQNLQKIPDKLY